MMVSLELGLSLGLGSRYGLSRSGMLAWTVAGGSQL